MIGTIGRLGLACFAFVGGHVLISSTPLRGIFVRLFRERFYRLLYSLLMIAAFVWMVATYNTAPAVAIWDACLSYLSHPGVPSIYSIGPPNGGSALRHGHHIHLLDFEVDHGQASPRSFRRILPPNAEQGHVDAGSVHVAAERC